MHIHALFCKPTIYTAATAACYILYHQHYQYHCCYYRIVQNFRGIKLSRLDHHVSSYSQKNFCVCIKTTSTSLKHFEIRVKPFTVQGKTAKSVKVLSLKGFVLYGKKWYCTNRMSIYLQMLMTRFRFCACSFCSWGYT